MEYTLVDWRKQIILLYLLICLFPLLVSVRLPRECGKNQVRRYNGRTQICCYTATCYPGQQFETCTTHLGHDTCHNCEPGYTHKDVFNTAVWEHRINVCVVEIEDCTQYLDLRLVNGTCECDVTRGYHGLDRNKCSADNGTCMIAGHELTIHGKCEECSAGYFKDTNDYSLCRTKTRCGIGQEINNEGSTTQDRTCRMKYFTSQPSMGPDHPSTVTDFKTNKTNYAVINQTEGQNKTVSHADNDDNDEPENRSVPKPKNSNENVYGLITAVVSCLIAIIIVVCCIWKRCVWRKTNQQSGHPSDNIERLNVISCCSFQRIGHARAVQVGNQNQMRFSDIDLGKSTVPETEQFLSDQTSQPSHHIKKLSYNSAEGSCHDALLPDSPATYYDLSEDHFGHYIDRSMNDMEIDGLSWEVSTPPVPNDTQPKEIYEEPLLEQFNSEITVTNTPSNMPILKYPINAEDDDSKPKELYKESFLEESHSEVAVTNIPCNLTNLLHQDCTNIVINREEDNHQTRPIATVQPTVRTADCQNQQQLEGSGQNLQTSRTTNTGQELETATNNDNYKFVPSHAGRNELEPLQGHEIPILNTIESENSPDLTAEVGQIGTDYNNSRISGYTSQAGSSTGSQAGSIPTIHGTSRNFINLNPSQTVLSQLEPQPRITSLRVIEPVGPNISELGLPVCPPESQNGVDVSTPRTADENIEPEQT